jgi:hypothetical protein
MNQWKKMLNGNLSKGIIDAILILGLVLSLCQIHHCIISMFFTGLICFHIWQHLNFLTKLVKRKQYRNNKLTTITFLIFILAVCSILLFIISFTPFTLILHNVIAHFFVIIVIIHIIRNSKKLVILFTKSK